MEVSGEHFLWQDDRGRLTVGPSMAECGGYLSQPGRQRMIKGCVRLTVFSFKCIPSKFEERGYKWVGESFVWLNC